MAHLPCCAISILPPSKFKINQKNKNKIVMAHLRTVRHYYAVYMAGRVLSSLPLHSSPPLHLSSTPNLEIIIEDINTHSHLR